jgi:AcrR family transcriptional regulator
MTSIKECKKNTSKKPPQERGLATRELLMKTALENFTTLGYDASSTRQIETQAGVKRGLIAYHFETKEKLWKSAVAWSLQESTAEMALTLKTAKNVDARGRMRFLVRAYVRFCARSPEFHRLMIKEGTENGWRLKWLVEHSVAPWYGRLEKIFNEASNLGVAPKMDYHHFYYILTGAASLIFSMAPESVLVANIDPMDEKFLTAHADALAELFFPE